MTEVAARTSRALKGLCSTAWKSTGTWAQDGHSGNEKLYAWKEEVAASLNEALCRILCKSHRSHSVEQMFKQVGGNSEAVDGLFTLQNFVRGGNTYLRMVASVVRVLEHSVSVKVGEDPPEGATAFGEQLRDFCVQQRRFFHYAGVDERADRAEHERASRAQQRYERAWADHLKLWNGPMEPLPGEHIVTFVSVGADQKSFGADGEQLHSSLPRCRDDQAGTRQMVQAHRCP